MSQRGKTPTPSGAPRGGRRRGALALRPSGEGPRDAEGLTAPAKEIGGCALELATLRARIGVAEPAPGAADLLPEVDPLAVSLAEVYVKSLPEAKEVSGATGVSAEQLAALLGQHSEMVRLYETVEQLGGDLGDGRALVALVQGRAVRRVVRKVRALLADASVPLGVREKLQSDAAELLRLAAAEREQRQKRRRKTMDLGRATTARLSAQARRRRMLDAMLALRRGQDVPEEALRDASEAYAELAEAPPERRRPER